MEVGKRREGEEGAGLCSMSCGRRWRYRACARPPAAKGKCPPMSEVCCCGLCAVMLRIEGTAFGCGTGGGEREKESVLPCSDQGEVAGKKEEGVGPCSMSCGRGWRYRACARPPAAKGKCPPMSEVCCCGLCAVMPPIEGTAFGCGKEGGEGKNLRYRAQTKERW